MNKTKRERMLNWFQRMRELGFSCDEACQLRRIEMTLHRWDEAECGESNDYASIGIERDEKTGKPFRVIRPHSSIEAHYHAIPDREKGALTRLGKIMAKHTNKWAYHQTDCRGCALYVGPVALIAGRSLDACYSSIGICANY